MKIISNNTKVQKLLIRKIILSLVICIVTISTSIFVSANPYCGTERIDFDKSDRFISTLGEPTIVVPGAVGTIRFGGVKYDNGNVKITLKRVPMEYTQYFPHETVETVTLKGKGWDSNCIVFNLSQKDTNYYYYIIVENNNSDGGHAFIIYSE